MRLKGYLTEGKDVTGMLIRDCKPFIKATSTFFTRSYTNDSDPLKLGALDIVKVKPRTNRIPKDTPLYLHKILDNWFKQKFGWKARSEGVFTTPGNSDFYGEAVNLFFPIGPFKFITSTSVRDLYNTLDNILTRMDSEEKNRITKRSSWSDLKDLTKKDHYPLLDKLFRDFITKYGKSYIGKDLKGSSMKWEDSESEFVFKCKEYYLIGENVVPSIDYLKGEI